MTIPEFIQTAPAERQDTLSKFYEIILANDASVVAAVKPMMSKDMILFEERCYMKYGLASVKAYMSLHCLPMYMNPALYDEFVKMLPKASFQKGCINFKDETEFPQSALAEIIKACSTTNIAEVLEKRKKK
jgi:hypothetical protein